MNMFEDIFVGDWNWDMKTYIGMKVGTGIGTGNRGWPNIKSLFELFRHVDKLEKGTRTVLYT